jgi:LEA14-like dessication related protein
MWHNFDLSCIKLLMKKNIFLITAIIMMVAVIACKTVKPSFQEPVISFHSASISDITISNAQILCKIQVQNPNSSEIPFPQINWKIFINEKSYKDGEVKANGKIKARSTVFIDVPIKIEYLNFFKTFKSLIGSKKASYKIAITVKFSSRDFGEKVWNFDNTGDIPLPQLPLISQTNMIIESADYSKAQIMVTINVENPNAFEVPSPKFYYDYQLNKKSFIKGVIENETPLAPSSVTPVKFRMVVNYADLYRTFSGFSFSRETAGLLVLTCDFGIPVFSGETMHFEIPGSFPVRR